MPEKRKKYRSILEVFEDIEKEIEEENKKKAPPIQTERETVIADIPLKTGEEKLPEKKAGIEEILFPESKYVFDLSNVRDEIRRNKGVLFNFIASYFLHLDLPNISKIHKEMAHGDMASNIWYKGESVIGEPMRVQDEGYEIFFGELSSEIPDEKALSMRKNRENFLVCLLGFGPKFEKIKMDIGTIFFRSPQGISVARNYSRSIIEVIDSVKQDPTIDIDMLIPDKISESDYPYFRDILSQMTYEFREIPDEEVPVAVEEPVELKAMGIKLEPLTTHPYIGNPFGNLYAAFPRIKVLYEYFKDEIHTLVNDLSNTLNRYGLNFSIDTWQEIKNNFAKLKTRFEKEKEFIGELKEEEGRKFSRLSEKITRSRKKALSLPDKNVLFSITSMGKRKKIGINPTKEILKALDSILMGYLLKKYAERT